MEEKPKVVVSRTRRPEPGVKEFSFTESDVRSASGIVASYRSRAYEAFKRHGLPDTTQEAWRRTTWYLEDLVAKRKAKELWMLNPKLTAREALEIGLVNRVVSDDKLREETRKLALELAERGPFALPSVKAAFNARHGGVGGLGRMAHDLLLRGYLESDESHELAEAFRAKRKPDGSKFGR